MVRLADDVDGEAKGRGVRKSAVAEGVLSRKIICRVRVTSGGAEDGDILDGRRA